MLTEDKLEQLVRPGIQEARFQIVAAAWPRIADAIGLPLGEFGT